MTHFTLDARRLLCPLPVIRTQNKIKTLQTGDALEVICTDPGANHDIPAWCRIHGHKIIDTVVEEDEIRITVSIDKR